MTDFRPPLCVWCTGEPSVAVDSNDICHEATEIAEITGQVVGYPTATVQLYKLNDNNGMEMVGLETNLCVRELPKSLYSPPPSIPLPPSPSLHPPPSIPLPPSPSLQVEVSRVDIVQPSVDNANFNISIRNLLTSDQAMYAVQATNTEGISEPVHVSLTVKGEL